MGWVIVVIALVQLIAALSIWAGGQFGRWVGIIGAGISAIGALLCRSQDSRSGRCACSSSTS
jgi:hypothetical protein